MARYRALVRWPSGAYWGDPAMPRDTATPIDGRFTDNDSWSTNEIDIGWQAVACTTSTSDNGSHEETRSDTTPPSVEPHPALDDRCRARPFELEAEQLRASAPAMRRSTGEGVRRVRGAPDGCLSSVQLRRGSGLPSQQTCVLISTQKLTEGGIVVSGQPPQDAAPVTPEHRHATDQHRMLKGAKYGTGEMIQRRRTHEILAEARPCAPGPHALMAGALRPEVDETERLLVDALRHPTQHPRAVAIDAIPHHLLDEPSDLGETRSTVELRHAHRHLVAAYFRFECSCTRMRRTRVCPTWYRGEAPPPCDAPALRNIRPAGRGRGPVCRWYSKSKGSMVAYPALKASMTPGPTLRRPRSPLRTRRRYDSCRSVLLDNLRRLVLRPIVNHNPQRRGERLTSDALDGAPRIQRLVPTRRDQAISAGSRVITSRRQYGHASTRWRWHQRIRMYSAHTLDQYRPGRSILVRGPQSFDGLSIQTHGARQLRVTHGVVHLASQRFPNPAVERQHEPLFRPFEERRVETFEPDAPQQLLCGPAARIASHPKADSRPPQPRCLPAAGASRAIPPCSPRRYRAEVAPPGTHAARERPQRTRGFARPSRNGVDPTARVSDRTPSCRRLPKAVVVPESPAGTVHTRVGTTPSCPPRHGPSPAAWPSAFGEASRLRRQRGTG